MANLAPTIAEVFALLDADGTYEVYDPAPDDAVYPYLSIGEPTQAPPTVGELNADESEQTITFDGWSRFAGKDECYAMQAWLKGLLHHQILTSGWAIYEEFVTIRDESGPDEPMQHLIARYRIHTN